VTYERGFWRDAEALKAAYEGVGSMADLAVVAGTSTKTLLHWWRRHELPKLPKGERPAPVLAETNDAWLLGALKKAGDQASVSELADLADVAPRRVREALERLGDAGYRVREEDEAVRLERIPTETGERHTARPELFDGDLFRFAIVSDTHLGSKAERIDALQTAYEVIAREGITTVYHGGDLVDGMGIYRTQNTEVSLHTYEDQVDHACEVVPQVDGVTTYIISGNHDLEGDFGKAGADPVQAFCNRREDFEYLGRYSAYVDLPNGGSVHLLHPMGGGSYATSYRPQKIVEAYEGGSKPSVLVVAHYHKLGWFPSRGVQILMAGTFQGPTTYSIRKAFGSPGWGFYIVTCRLADDGSIVRFQPEAYPFYLGR
jgi:predicted phosphodiesterase